MQCGAFAGSVVCVGPYHLGEVEMFAHQINASSSFGIA